MNDHGVMPWVVRLCVFGMWSAEAERADLKRPANFR